MNLIEKNWDVIVVGAGISGLSARKQAKSQGYQVLTLEKSRGLGGRAATRRSDGIAFDFGAQFFSVKGPEFQSLLAVGQSDQLREIKLEDDKKYSRWAHSEGMSRLSSFLVEEPADLSSPILRSTRVVELKATLTQNLWEVVTEAQETFLARRVVISSPIPQSLEILSKIQDAMDPVQLTRLRGISYDSCIAAAYSMDQPTDMKGFGVLRNPSAEISGIFDQSKKGVMTSLPVLVVHAAPLLSQVLWSELDSVILTQLWKKTQEILSPDALPDHYQSAWIHKWRYAEPRKRQDRFFEQIQIDSCPPLFLVGDGFQDSRIEGAFESGRLAGLALKGNLEELL